MIEDKWTNAQQQLVLVTKNSMANEMVFAILNYLHTIRSIDKFPIGKTGFSYSFIPNCGFETQFSPANRPTIQRRRFEFVDFKFWSLLDFFCLFFKFKYFIALGFLGFGTSRFVLFCFAGGTNNRINWNEWFE